MSKKLINFITVMFVAFALLITTASPAFASSNAKSEAEVEGSISSVGSGSISVAPKKGGAAITVSVDGSTRIKRDGKNVAVTDLQAGDRVSVKYNKTTMLALRIDAKAKKPSSNSNSSSNKTGEVSGVVSSTGLGTITITKRGGSSVTITVDGSTRIKRNGKNVGAADIQSGDKVEVKYNKTTMLASKVEAKGVKTNSNSNSNTNSNSNSNSNSSDDDSNSNSNSNSNSTP